LEKDLQKKITPKKMTVNDAKVILEYGNNVKKKLIVVKKSLFCLPHTNKLRLILLWLVEWTYFDRFVMTIIFMNSICLAAYDYEDREEKFARN
jgi:hypothetical protein